MGVLAATTICPDTCTHIGSVLLDLLGVDERDQSEKAADSFEETTP